MSDLLPKVLQEMLTHAEETYSKGDIAKAETEYLLAIDYSSKVYHSSSATTGLVLLQLLNFYETTGQKHNAAITTGRANAVLTAYRNS